MSRLPLWLAVGGCSVALLVPAHAARPAAGGGLDETGEALLEQAARAAETLDYQGTQFVAFWSESGSTSAVVEVSHVGGEGAVMRIEPTPQSPAGAVFRSGGEGGAPGAVGFDPATLALLHRNFETAVTGSDTVAGRPTDVVAVRRPGQSPSARFWLDRETRLVLRREVLDGDGRTLRASAFVRVTFGTERPMQSDGAEQTPKAVGRRLDDDALRSLGDDGWRLPSVLPAGLELYDARVTGRGDDERLHLTYSDGVSTLSLFQQRGRLDKGSLDGFRRIKVGDASAYASTSFPRRVVWSGDGVVFTLVAECQQDMLEGVVDALPHEDSGRGLRGRLSAGVRRIGSWLNPF